jgi:hypothetical protein
LAIRSPSEKNYNGAKLRKAADRDFYGWGSIFSLAIKSTPPHETISRKSEVSSIYKHKQRGVMNKVVAVTNLGITGFYLYAIVLHMIRPGVNTGYTRMLMFVCLATIPIAFMMAIIGGRNRWPLFVAQAKVMAAGGLSSVLLVAGTGRVIVSHAAGHAPGSLVRDGAAFRFVISSVFYSCPTSVGSGTRQSFCPYSRHPGGDAFRLVFNRYRNCLDIATIRLRGGYVPAAFASGLARLWGCGQGVLRRVCFFPAQSASRILPCFFEFMGSKITLY